MTEAEWLACDKFKPMFELYAERGGDRKFRLFGLACVRRTFDLLREEFREDGLRTLQTVERFIDGRASSDELEAASFFHVCDSDPDCAGCVIEHLYRACEETGPECIARVRSAANQAVRALVEAVVYEAMNERLNEAPPGVDLMEWGMALDRSPEESARLEKAEEELRAQTAAAEKARQAALLRDIFGNPFRPPSAIDASWLAWKDGIVVRLAQGIYQEHAFNRLPILADSLEEAGCADPELLAHCRQQAEHARGCWLLDRLLDKS